MLVSVRASGKSLVKLLRIRIIEFEKSMGNIVELIPGKLFKRALKNDSQISGHFESDKQYEVVWPDLSMSNYRTASELFNSWAL